MGNCKNPTQIPPSPTSDKSYLNCSHFSRSQQTTVSGLFERKGKKEQASPLCGAFAICDTTAFMKSRYFPSSGGAHAASMSSRSCGWTSKQNHNHNFGKGQDVKHFSRYKGLTYYLWPQKKYCFGIDFHQSPIRRAFEF